MFLSMASKLWSTKAGLNLVLKWNCTVPSPRSWYGNGALWNWSVLLGCFLGPLPELDMKVNFLMT